VIPQDWIKLRDALHELEKTYGRENVQYALANLSFINYDVPEVVLVPKP
jgi:hypothetical protein